MRENVSMVLNLALMFTSWSRSTESACMWMFSLHISKLFTLWILKQYPGLSELSVGSYVLLHIVLTLSYPYSYTVYMLFYRHLWYRSSDSSFLYIVRCFFVGTQTTPFVVQSFMEEGKSLQEMVQALKPVTSIFGNGLLNLYWKIESII
jgi:hypothetical protein